MAFNETLNMTSSPIADYVHSFTLVQNKIFNDLLLFLIVLAVILIASRVLIFITEKIILKFTKKTKTKLDDLLIDALTNPVFFIFSLFGLYIALTTLIYSAVVLFYIRKVLISVAFFIFAIIVIRVLDILVTNWGEKFAKKTKSEVDDALLALVHKFLIVLFYIFAILLTLWFWGVDIGPFLASLGVAGLAIGLALQPTLANIFGGIQLILDKAYKVGDRIKLESGDVGEIRDIGFRSTRIETLDGDLLIVPNAVMASSKVYNYTLPHERRRGVVKFGVEYGNDIEKIEKIALNVVKKNKELLAEPKPEIMFSQLGDSSLDFSLYFWTSHYRDVPRYEGKVRNEVYLELKKAGIHMAYPTRTLYMKH